MSKPILAAMLSCSGTKLTDEEKRFFEEYNPLGVSLFARNIKNVAQLKKLIQQIKEVINRDDVLIGIDEEGGRVSHLRGIIKLKNIDSQFIAEEDLGKAAIKYTKLHAELISSYMHQLGLNTNYAPVIDRKMKRQSAVLQSRCFSANPKIIIKHARTMADTYINTGICPCIKHIPGHFDTISDPHLELPMTDLAKSEVYKEIEYMKDFANYPLAMTSHIMLKDFDNQYPVTMSKKCITEILRNYLKLESLLISDAIDMHALKGSISERAENCWNAGIDIVCYCSGKTEDIYNICQQKRFMTEKAQIRFAIIKKIIHNIPKDINISEADRLYLQKFHKEMHKEYAYDATEVLNQMLAKGENI